MPLWKISDHPTDKDLSFVTNSDPIGSYSLNGICKPKIALMLKHSNGLVKFSAEVGQFPSCCGLVLANGFSEGYSPPKEHIIFFMEKLKKFAFKTCGYSSVICVLNSPQREKWGDAFVEAGFKELKEYAFVNTRTHKVITHYIANKT